MNCQRADILTANIIPVCLAQDFSAIIAHPALKHPALIQRHRQTTIKLLAQDITSSLAWRVT